MHLRSVRWVNCCAKINWIKMVFSADVKIILNILFLCDVSGTDCSVNGESSSPTWMQVFNAVQGHCTARCLLCHYWTGWVHLYHQFGKMVNMPCRHDYPSVKREKISVYYYYHFNSFIVFMDRILSKGTILNEAKNKFYLRISKKLYLSISSSSIWVSK